MSLIVFYAKQDTLITSKEELVEIVTLDDNLVKTI